VFISILRYLQRKLHSGFLTAFAVMCVYVLFLGEEFTRGVRTKEAEEATLDLLKYMGRDPKYRKANGHNPSWLFTGLGLGKRSGHEQLR
jgi:hypothetical protein